jgi:PAS domain S-box-containing protein
MIGSLDDARVLGAFFDSTITPLVFLDRDFNFIRVNDAYAKACGRPASDFPGHNHFEFYPNAEGEAIFRRVVNTRKPFRARAKPFVFPDHPEWGTTYWDWTLSPVLDDKGEVEFLAFSLNDVTEAVRAHEEVGRSESLLRKVLETLPIGVWIIDKTGRIIIGNPAGESIWGGMRYVGIDGYGEYKGWWVDSGRRIRPEEWAAARAVTWGETSLNEEVEIEGFDGAHKIILHSALPILDEGNVVRGAIVINQDITLRRTVEADRLRLAAAVEQIADGIAIMDPDGGILYANPVFYKHHGLERHDPAASSFPAVLEAEAGDGEALRKMREALGAGRAWNWRMARRAADGRIREFELKVSPLRDGSGRFSGSISVERDITHDVRMEERIRQWQKMEALGTLAGGIAHDFNNILLPIQINAELMLGHESEDAPATRRIGQILEAARRGKEMVRQIIAFSRQQEPERKPVDLNQVIKESLELIRISMPKSIEILEKIEVSSAPAVADATQIHQIMMNLASNAAHAMRGKGGVLEVGLADVAIDAETASRLIDLKPGPHLRLSVKDSGHGMSPEVMRRVFEPFFTTKGKGEGTGMGLAVVHGIVRAHGGVITASSEPGKGSTFTVYLPRIVGPPKPQQNVSSAPATGTGRILFVDDEDIQVRAMDKLLEHLGYQSVGLTDPRKALEVFRGRPDDFDLAIMDQTMPHMSGGELAREILKVRPGLPIILCTGYSENLNEEEALAMGIKAFLMKPFSVKEIAETIRRALHPDL